MGLDLDQPPGQLTWLFPGFLSGSIILFLGVSSPLLFIILSSFIGPQPRRLCGLVGFPPAAGGRGDPALGWAVLRKKEDRGKQRGLGGAEQRQTLSSALTPACCRCVLRQFLYSHCSLMIFPHKKSPWISHENPTHGGCRF